ncbi:sigma-70 family RNA polymerase sigma factor [Candidatus Peregrinibacteria bacterium]|nr:sigma-70 family RNA polymerase sigma factor [Candidatus Peregrinibacteria bacterium]
MRPIKCEKKSDKQLVQLTLKNTDYFGYLVRRYEEKLNRYIRRLTHLDAETIEDLLQEVFLKIYKNLNDYDSDFSFSSWAYRIAHNEAISHFRKNEKRPKTVQINNEEGVNFLDILPDDINLRDDYVKKELAQKVRALIDELPEKYRAVLILKFMEEKSYEEISDILKIPAGTVATQLNRAKAHFKQLAIDNHLNKPDNQ